MKGGMRLLGVEAVKLAGEAARLFGESVDHGADLGVASAVSEDFEAPARAPPADDFDFDLATAPLVHEGARGAEEVDGASADEGAAIIFDDVSAAGGGDTEGGIDGEPGPIAGGGAIGHVVAEATADAIGPAAGFGLGVRGGADEEALAWFEGFGGVNGGGRFGDGGWGGGGRFAASEEEDGENGEEE